MKYQFKTNVMCANCIAKVAPYLNNNRNIKHWEIDILNPDKILTVETDLSDERVKEIVQEAGYRAERVDVQDI